MKRLVPITLGLWMALASAALLTACSDESGGSGGSGGTTTTTSTTTTTTTGTGGGGGAGGSTGTGGNTGTGGAGGGSAAQLCTDSGGTVQTASCCMATGDFPDLCAVGACGCSPENSHDVQICACPQGQCFDGTGCVAGP